MISTLRQLLRDLILLSAVSMTAIFVASLCGGTGCWVPFSNSEIFWQLRIPRALLAFAVGGALALSGALMQLLLRNPLADPYVLGVSGGAAVGALSAIWLVPASLSVLGLHVGSLVGAFAAIGLLFSLTRPSINKLSSFNPKEGGEGRLILTGVMLSTGSGALISLLLTLSDDKSLRGIFFWLMGDLDENEVMWPVWIVLLLALVWSVRNAVALNVLAQGELNAHLLGLPVKRLRTMTLLIASGTAAVAVSAAGTIGFIGLVVPHAIRLVHGGDHRRLLPASVLLGGSMLCMADLAARSLFAPVQLPVGVVTSSVGVPVFLWLLARTR